MGSTRLAPLLRTFDIFHKQQDYFTTIENSRNQQGILYTTRRSINRQTPRKFQEIQAWICGKKTEGFE